MSSRLTTPVSKLTRSISTSPAVARPSHLLNNATKTATGAGRKRDLTPEEAPAERQHSTSTTTTRHRPQVPTPARTIPFMQTFHHSAPRPAAPSFTTIDRAVLPSLDALSWSSPGAAAPGPGQYDPYAHIRVPLLPDGGSRASAFHAPEAPDAPLPRPEISVVAADPLQVPPAALTEVEGMGVDGVELGFAHLLGREEEQAKESYEMGAGMIRDLWRGMVDDVFGAQGGAAGRSSSGGSSGGNGPASAA